MRIRVEIGEQDYEFTVPLQLEEQLSQERHDRQLASMAHRDRELLVKAQEKRIKELGNEMEAANEKIGRLLPLLQTSLRLIGQFAPPGSYGIEDFRNTIQKELNQ